MRPRNPPMAARLRRDHQPHNPSAMCRNHLWYAIFALFSLWSLLVFLNYTSLIFRVKSFAGIYVYSVNHHESAHLRPPSGENATAIGGGDENDDEKEAVGGGEKKAGKNATAIGGGNENGEEKEAVGGGEKKVIKIASKNATAIRGGNENDNEKEAGGGGEKKAVEIAGGPPPPPAKKKQKRRGKKRGKGKNPTVEKHPSLSSSPAKKCKAAIKSDRESCDGRYIYVHVIPRKFNVDLLRDCKSLDKWMDMCQYVKNSGMGPPLSESDVAVFPGGGWFATNQFLLEVIFHNRMKLYDCLTDDSSQAAAIFVPFYAGLDVARHLWNGDAAARDYAAADLVRWLRRKPEWGQFWGRDHFFVGGRITWDFRRSENRKDPDWGTRLLYLPEARNMTALVIESSPWNNNDFGIPYPTYFHPATDDQVFEWQDRMRNQSRRYLFSFAGAPRPDRRDSIRNELIKQCEESKRCSMVNCHDFNNKCHNPAELMRVFQNSHFCLQPPGDSYTRRSTFDSILAGCIPVFFHPGSAYAQYYWHFPRNYQKYSVFISMNEVRARRVSVEGVLERISRGTVEAMREEVVRLIPRVVYGDPRCRLERVKDAFDVAVDGVLGRVGRIKEDMRNGRNESFGYDETQAWKYEWNGKLEGHEWDPYFSGQFDYEGGNDTKF